MLAAGVGIAVQGAVNGRLGQRIGVLPTVAFSTLISAVSLQLLLLVSGRSLATPYQAFRERPWLWLGGVCGFAFLLGIVYAQPRIGVFAAIGLAVAGQLAGGILLDSFGWLGTTRVAVGPVRLLGIALVVVGAILALRR
jgi:transporter family-2 protein